MLGIPCSGKLLHEHDGNAVGIDIERARASHCADIIKMADQFLFDPLDAELDQGNESKVCAEQFYMILLGIIAIIRDDLGAADAEGLKLPQGIFNRDDIRLVARLFCESVQLSGLNRRLCQGCLANSVLTTQLPAVIRLMSHPDQHLFQRGNPCS